MARVATLLVLVVGAAYGAALRGWLLVHLAFQSDQAVVGLMARQILNGHPTVFYWGSFYGGIEAYAVAPAVWLFGTSSTIVNATPAVLAAAAGALAGWTVALATANRRLGVLTGALVWVWPYAAVYNSVRELGLRGVALCCGLALLLCALAVSRGRRHLVVYGLLGLAAGLGWWASPEIVYYAVPSAVLLVASWDRLRHPRLRGPWRPLPFVVGVLAVGLGALPWLYANVGSNFASLHAGALGSSGIGYRTRLADTFTHVLPTQLGLQGVPGGRWVGGPTAGPVLYGLVLALVAAALLKAGWAIGRRHRGRRWLGALALAVVAFPFLYAVFPASFYWADGRYGVYLPPLLALLFASALVPLGPPVPGAAGAHTRRRRRAARGSGTRAAVLTLAACVGVVGAGSLTVAAASTQGVPAAPGAFFSGWSTVDREGPARQVVDDLERAHLRHAFGDYWVAYVLDYLSQGRLQVSPAAYDQPRSLSLYRSVARAPRQAWLFAAPGRQAAATVAFSNPDPGPSGYRLAQFEHYLLRNDIFYRVVPLGVLEAVVPGRPVAAPPLHRRAVHPSPPSFG